MLDILKKNRIIAYFRYVNDVFILYHTNLTDINSTVFDMTKINSSDLTMKIIFEQFYFEIVRKPTATDIMMEQNNCHPTEHKMAEVNY